MNELTQESPRAQTDDALAELDYDNSALALTDICRSIAEVMRVGPSRPRRVRIALGAASVEVEWDGQDTPGSTAPAGQYLHGAGAAEGAEAEAVVEGHRECAPLVGTFYTAPAPGAPPFVQPGDRVEAGQQLGIIEAMKLMNPLEATRAGQVVEVLVGDGEPVEYGEPLVLIDPDTTGADDADGGA
ncbi:acetyl-CoA carboxylase biotin carboxyl carrier protein [Streptomyces iconiensis]|uniref:Biotin carboxyl carrier protein of acetyl-CoA carboxylase n=1 Tax=Streptomyces iconiensis TaxID=1384038 RepID=A0ABT6ZY23_9ACTN|nr:biotin/lipoyl-containing protein [Streptomyces iconiensis]MDJ1133973.1 acetyl-CoA carboxylase biotin carboxyl carrier protein subunit [Streptomyces iconiensis]